LIKPPSSSSLPTSCYPFFKLSFLFISSISFFFYSFIFLIASVLAELSPAGLVSFFPFGGFYCCFDAVCWLLSFSFCAFLLATATIGASVGFFY